MHGHPLRKHISSGPTSTIHPPAHPQADRPLLRPRLYSAIRRVVHSLDIPTDNKTLGHRRWCGVVWCSHLKQLSLLPPRHRPFAAWKHPAGCGRASAAIRPAECDAPSRKIGIQYSADYHCRNCDCDRTYRAASPAQHHRALGAAAIDTKRHSETAHILRLHTLPLSDLDVGPPREIALSPAPAERAPTHI